jgi:DNA-binding NtrC family response regulator
MTPLAARKLNAVIVDDDPSVVRIAAAMISGALKDRLEIVSFTDPLQAQHWIDQNCCDLLISDIEMPNVDGLEMLRFAKRRNAWTQVIFMTAHSSWSRVSEAIELGASNYLLKPINRQEILSVVEQEYIRCARWQNAVKGTLARQVAKV